ncbi:MAG: hypothetical protein AAF488_13110 [Planctomycetota bacterium]
MLLRIACLLGCLTAISGCRFVEPGAGSTTVRDVDFEREDLNALLDELERAWKAGDQVGDWVATREQTKTVLDARDWRSAAGHLYALRSSTSARHAPLWLLSRPSYLIAGDSLEQDDYASSCLFIPLAILLTPIDAVQLLFQVPYKTYVDWKVTDAEVQTALEDLARARALGFDRDHLQVHMKYGNPLHLDRIGYDLPDVGSDSDGE